MTNLLLIQPEGSAGLAFESWIDRESFGLAVKTPGPAAFEALRSGIFDAAVLRAPAVAESLAATLAAVRRLQPNLPIVVVLGTADASSDAALFGQGADLVLHEPLPREAFTRAVARFAAPRPPVAGFAAGTFTGGFPPVQATTPLPPSALQVLRDVSRVLGYSLDLKQFAKHFLQKLREIVGVNRIAIFLEPTPNGPMAAERTAQSNRLPLAASIGFPAHVIECIELSRSSGIGQRVAMSGQILRLPVESPVALQHEDPRVVREFEILGGRVAIPIHDRERCLGVAILGGKLTGERFAGDELELIYHLMEELGLAVRNSWLHLQLAASHRLFSDVLETMTSGSLVIGSTLEVLHANRACLAFLRGPAGTAARAEPLRFTELPPAVAGPVHELVENGRECAPFLTELPACPGQVFRVVLLPFHPEPRKLPQPVMILLEDFTPVEAAKRAEIESANLKLIALIAKRFAHEIRNSLVPLTTHQQLFDSEYGNEDFRLSLKNALATETGRIQRFTEQMLFLSHPQNPPTEIGPLENLLRDAFTAAQQLFGHPGRLDLVRDAPHPLIKFHRPSLLHALKEIFLNCLQSGGPSPTVKVTLSARTSADGHPQLAVAVRDSGTGFSPAVLPRAAEPFFTTRNTGVGLGLTVARKILHDHGGELHIQSRTDNCDADILLLFPQDF